MRFLNDAATRVEQALEWILSDRVQRIVGPIWLTMAGLWTLWLTVKIISAAN